MPLAGLATVHLVLAWLLSSLVTRKHGLVVFLLLVLPLLPALVAFARGRRRGLYGLLYVTILATVSGLGFEAALRLHPGLLRGQLANVAFSGYHWQAGGIYDLDPNVGPRLRPNVSRPMYWNGHHWHHRTNARGFRGPDLDHADAVFLGDSMVYGHGLEEEATLPAQFARASGRPTANLGQQGTCLIQDYLILQKRGAALHPGAVFLCAHFNDIEDARTYYDDDQLRAFVDGREEQPLVRAAYQPPPRFDLAAFWSRHLALPTDSGGVLSSALQARFRRGATDAPFVSRDPFVPTAAEREAGVPGLGEGDDEALRLAWQSQVRAIALTRALCGRWGAQLVVFDLGYPRAFTGAVEAAARAAGAGYSPAGRVALEHALAGEPMYLADDGHWSAVGAAVVANELVKYPVPLSP